MVNENEAATLSGEADIRQAIGWFHQQGCRQVVVTLGAEGITVSDSETIDHFPAHRVKAVDTTGAGDSFNGGLAFALSTGLNLQEACQYGNAVAALSTTKLGAQTGMPTRAEVETFINNFGETTNR